MILSSECPGYYREKGNAMGKRSGNFNNLEKMQRIDLLKQIAAEAKVLGMSPEEYLKLCRDVSTTSAAPVEEINREERTDGS
jgi:hypothetical protein